MSHDRRGIYNVLFLCTGYSAPMICSKKAHLDTSRLRSKSWDEFARPGAPVMDFVFTVCDQAAGEVCPVWPGNPVTARWGVPDPALVQGTEAERRRASATRMSSLRTGLSFWWRCRSKSSAG